MKIIIDGKEVLNLTETQKKTIKNEILSEIFDDDMTRRCKYWLEIPQKKYAHIHQKSLISELEKKGTTTIPSNLLKLAEDHSDAFPCKYGYEDITQDILCNVGDQSFSFSVSHRKISRKMKNHLQEKMSKRKYLSYEKEELEQRIAWILQNKCERCLHRLRLAWMPRLEERGISEVPIDDDAFSELVFSQSDYKDRDARDLEEAEIEGR